MQKTLILTLALLCSSLLRAQDLNCTVDVISSRVTGTNTQIFDDLKTAIVQFMNNRKWINSNVEPNEKIDCNFILDIQKFSIDQFSCIVNIQSSRTVYGTNYNTKVFSYVDNNVNFQYAQFQQLEYVENSYTNNLSSILGFYANMIVGFDFDTYKLNGGTQYFKKAQAIRDAAINSGSGWKSSDGSGSRNRYFLVDNILDSRFSSMRSANYRYHIKGLDVMSTDMEKGRAEIYTSIKDLKLVYDALPNAYILKLWFNAKSSEVIEIFSRGTPTQKSKTTELLAKMDPANRSRYEDGILKKK